MKKIYIATVFVVITLMFVLSNASSAGALNTTARYAEVPVFSEGDDKCANTTDQQMIDSIYEKIMKKYPGESKHVNVHIEGGVATVRGWASSEKIKKGIIKIVTKTKCVKSTNDYLVVGKGGGCGANEQSCGGACIPKTEKCNTRG